MFRGRRFLFLARLFGLARLVVGLLRLGGAGQREQGRKTGERHPPAVPPHARVCRGHYRPYPAATMLACTESSTASDGAPSVMAPSNQIPVTVIEPSPPVARMTAPCFFCGL